MKLLVHVPTRGSRAQRIIAPRSAIVSTGVPSIPGHVTAYYEGNTAGMVAGDFYEKLMIAAGRLVHQAPTIAAAQFPLTDFHVAAQYDTSRLAITQVVDEDMLTRWAGETISTIVGRRLPPGQVDWAEAAEIIRVGRPVSGSLQHARAYWSRAGQLFIFQERVKSVEVLPDDDPRMPLFTEPEAGASQLLM